MLKIALPALTFAIAFLLAKYLGIWRVLLATILILAAIFVSKVADLWVYIIWTSPFTGPFFLAGLIFGNFSHGIWAKNELRENESGIQNTSVQKSEESIEARFPNNDD
jgi:hypothetical protein